MFYTKTKLVILCLVFLAVNAAAHGVWVKERRGNTQIIVGEGSEDASCKESMITSVKAFNEMLT